MGLKVIFHHFTSLFLNDARSFSCQKSFCVSTQKSFCSLWIFFWSACFLEDGCTTLLSLTMNKFVCCHSFEHFLCMSCFSLAMNIFFLFLSTFFCFIWSFSCSQSQWGKKGGGWNLNIMSIAVFQSVCTCANAVHCILHNQVLRFSELEGLLQMTGCWKGTLLMEQWPCCGPCCPEP